jgi:hypothetical protein
MVYVITEDREEQIRVKEIMKLFCKEPLSVFEPNMLVCKTINFFNLILYFDLLNIFIF